MSHSRRIDLPDAPAEDAAKAAARTGHPAAAQDSRGAATTFMVDGVVLEVLAGYGIAHVRAADGSTYGLTQWTPGIHFADVREGQLVRVEVARKFSRVMHAQLLGDSSSRAVRGGDEDSEA